MCENSIFFLDFSIQSLFRYFFNISLNLQEEVKSGAGPKRNIRLLKANYIKEFTFLGQGEDPLDVKKCIVDLNTVQAREESAIRSNLTSSLFSPILKIYFRVFGAIQDFEIFIFLWV